MVLDYMRLHNTNPNGFQPPNSHYFSNLKETEESGRDHPGKIWTQRQNTLPSRGSSQGRSDNSR